MLIEKAAAKSSRLFLISRYAKHVLDSIRSEPFISL
jgi:hypothetical protein